MHVSLPNVNNGFSPLALTIAGTAVILALIAIVAVIAQSGKTKGR